MGDFSNLEKMGRELKCPICLSLFTSAVTLVCNHVFCNSCIQKSMKSASDCPVCKVPYHRREIRAAPHMDSLVNIYKSMEVSSGVNIFSTQAEPSSKELEQHKSYCEQEPQNGKKCKKESINQKMAKRKGAKWSMSDSPKISKSLMSRPSFPTKKRIQVSKNHNPETPKEVNVSSDRLREKSVLDGKGESGLAPFFWLRDEEDAENLTQQTNENEIMETPPCAPCFSDIKDSDDDIPDALALKDGADREINNAKFVDSEMFEWTQRPCSPELGSSPLKSQAAATSAEKEIDKMGIVPTLSSQRTGSKNSVNEAKESCKSGRRNLGRTYKKQVKRTKVQGKTENPPHNDNNKGGSIHSKEIMCRGSSVGCDNISGGNQITIENSPLHGSFTRRPKKKGLLMNNSGNIEDNVTHRKNGHCSSSSKKRKISDQCNPEVELAKDAPSDADNSAKLSETMGKLQSGSEKKVLQDSSDKGNATRNNNVAIRKCDNGPLKVECGFCHSAEESEFSGVMVHYFNGKPVEVDHNDGSKVIHSHRNCTEWAPNVYFEDDKAINLVAELARSRRIKCSLCGIRGAALGCFDKSCRKSFHVPCAKLTTECRWDSDNFVMLCPLHTSVKLPCELSDSQSKLRSKSTPKRICEIHRQKPVVKNSDVNWHWGSWGSSKRYILCSSALNNVDKQLVSEFERVSGIQIVKNWDPTVTHIIASADENGACKRTLKILMGILEGKWIIKAEWVKACLEAMQPVDEYLYEINVDVHGIKDGPKLGRLRISNNQSKPFEGCNFYLAGEYTTSYKGYLHDLVAAAGGVVLHRKPISRDLDLSSSKSSASSSTFVVYSLELPENCDPTEKNLIFDRRKTDAEAIASSTGSIVVSNTWVLNSIAGCKIRPLTG